MKKIIPAALILLMTTSTSTLAKGTPWYMAVKGGFMDANTSLTDSAINGGFGVGYRHNRYFAVEGELTQTFIDGDRNGNDWEVDTLSVFAAFRSNTRVKFKGKIGMSNIDYGGDDDTEISMGFGIGFWALGGLAEVEYTQISDDDELDFLSFGVNYFF